MTAAALLLDTNALIWLMAGDERLGQKRRLEIRHALETDRLIVSSLSFWEVAALVKRGLIRITDPVEQWYREAKQTGVREIEMNGQIALRAAEIEGFDNDPADRVIVATALHSRARLVTADTSILSWAEHYPAISCLDATE